MGEQSLLTASFFGMKITAFIISIGIYTAFFNLMYESAKVKPDIFSFYLIGALVLSPIWISIYVHLVEAMEEKK
jgi:apolipoprotein N-acyltransferase